MAQPDSAPGRPAAPRPPIRRLGPDDWETLARVRLTALADEPEAFYSTLAAEEHRTEAEWRASAATADWFAALDDVSSGDGDDDRDGDDRDGDSDGGAGSRGVPAGLVAVVHGGPPPGDAMLISMWVSAPHRGDGLAARLVEAALGSGADAGQERLTLWVRTQNERAIKAYERMGFAAEDPPPDARDYRCEGETFMARPLFT